MDLQRTIKNLKRQHADLVDMSRELVEELQSMKRLRPRYVRKSLSVYEGKMKIHLSMEDKHLYPQLVGHSDRRVRAFSEEYIAEMSGIYDVFNAFIVKWTSGELKNESKEELVREMGGVMNLVSKRIQKEEDELFPLLEKLKE